MNVHCQTHQTTIRTLDAAVLREMHDKRKHVIRRLYDGQTHDTIAQEMGVSYSYVSEIQNNVLPKALTKTEATRLRIRVYG